MVQLDLNGTKNEKNRIKMKLKIAGNKIFSYLNEEWVHKTPEEILRQRFIIRLITYYGYSPNQMARDIHMNHPREKQTNPITYIFIWPNEKEGKNPDKAFIVVECRAENVKIKRDDYFQGLNYADLLNIKFLVAVNERETKYFQTKEFEEIMDIPKADCVNDESAIKKLLSPRKPFTRDEFRKLLFKCHSIIRNNDKLSPEAAFDEVSKILFMKICYEKNPEDDPIFSLERYKRLEEDYERKIKPANLEKFGKEADIPYINYIFASAWKEFDKNKLFDQNETIRLKRISIEQIIEALEKYNLSDSADDVKGIAFEEFLGKTFRGELGQFFTPRTIVDFMVNVLDPREDEFICDPCCGSGGFLIKTFEYVRDLIEKNAKRASIIKRTELINHDLEQLGDKKRNKVLNEINKNHSILNGLVNPKDLTSRIFYLSRHCIFGTDANPRMARVAKMNMMMHGDGHCGVYHHDGLLNINGIYENRFHVIFTNPPFGARVDKDLILNPGDCFLDLETKEYNEKSYNESYIAAQKQLEEHIGKPVLDLFDLGKVTRLTEVLFMERCLRLLRPGGRMGIVLPEGVLNSPRLQKVRDYFEARAKILLVVSLPPGLFKSLGASVKASLVFLKKFTDEESKQYNEILRAVTREIKEKYAPEIQRLKKPGTLKKPGKPSNKEQLNKINALIKAEIQEKVKAQFDYKIHIAHVDKAGFSSTGAPDENQLPAIAREFAAYRETHPLWETKNIEVEYIDIVYSTGKGANTSFDLKKRNDD
jgi:type I restriction enzyme M protein